MRGAPTSVDLSPLPDSLRLQVEAARLELARRAFKDFLPYIMVSRPGVGMVPLEQWPHILDVADILATDRLLVWAKSRQIGISTILAAYAVWHASFTPMAWVVVFSKGEKDAWEFIYKCIDIYNSLPDALRRPLSKASTRENMTFSNGSRIEAMPATMDAGRGKTPTLTIMDEADYHEYLEACYNSVKPGGDDIQGQLILASTVNPYKLGSLFQSIYHSVPPLSSGCLDQKRQLPSQEQRLPARSRRAPSGRGPGLGKWPFPGDTSCRPGWVGLAIRRRASGTR